MPIKTTLTDNSRIFQIDFDFIDHQLQIASSEGQMQTIQLQPRSVANFYQAVIDALASLELERLSIPCLTKSQNQFRLSGMKPIMPTMQEPDKNKDLVG